MGGLAKLFKRIGNSLSSRGKRLLCYVVIGVVIVCFFSGKSNNTTLEAITVSPDERLIACYESGNGYTIRCFQSDGELVFAYEVLPEISAGGHCALWFGDDELCALFYRTDKIVHFGLDGTIMDITDDTDKMKRDEYPHFSRNGQQYKFVGTKIDVIYDPKSFFEYWLFEAERYLAVVSKEGEKRVILSWTAS